MPHKASTAYRCHAACVQEENVKLVWNFQVGALMMAPWSEGEKCLRSLVMLQHPPCPHRWSPTYYQQEASWHFPHTFCTPPTLNNLSLLHLISPSSSSSSSSSVAMSASSFLNYPLISCPRMQSYSKCLFLKFHSHKLVHFLFCLFFGLKNRVANHTAHRHCRD